MNKSRFRIGTLALLLLSILSAGNCVAGNWQIVGGRQNGGAPGNVVNSVFDVTYVGPNAEGDFGTSGWSVKDSQSAISGEMSVPGQHCTKNVTYHLTVPVLIPKDAKNGWSDTVTVTWSDPLSVSNTVVCVESIPTVSEWGLIIMGLLLLTVGTVFLLRHRREVMAAASGE